MSGNVCNRSRRSSCSVNRGKYFRRELPECCISLTSEEGKAIFTEALLAGYANCFFTLAAQFRTQDEPAYCGLSSLVMVLNALVVDPGVVWKDPWRWYHENMLECCVPLEVVKKKGIGLRQFTCIAKCNCLFTTVGHPKLEDEEDFRNVVKSYMRRDDAFLVATYSRKVLQQTGDGHFSPIAGYHPGRDLVLIMDTARFKYPPHWIRLPQLLEAMNTTDVSTGSSRGYILLSKNTSCDHPVIFCVSSQLTLAMHSLVPEDMRTFILKWRSYLGQHQNVAHTDRTSTLKEAIKHLARLLHDLKTENWLLDIHVLRDKCPCDLQDIYQRATDEVLNDMENTQLYGLVSQYSEMIPTMPAACNCSKEDAAQPLPPRKVVHTLHLVTMLLFSWPYAAADHLANNKTNTSSSNVKHPDTTTTTTTTTTDAAENGGGYMAEGGVFNADGGDDDGRDISGGVGGKGNSECNNQDGGGGVGGVDGKYISHSCNDGGGGDAGGGSGVGRVVGDEDKEEDDNMASTPLIQNVLGAYVGEQVLGAELLNEVEGLRNQLTVILAQVSSD
ncbi:glutathione gamma-glutamylcysteinyltransferase 1-like [Argonauta hians]